ncbi:unknown [Sinorhizobium phage PBC5]|nr:unknown [Sinorhizobium phage PBC5]
MPVLLLSPAVPYSTTEPSSSIASRYSWPELRPSLRTRSIAASRSGMLRLSEGVPADRKRPSAPATVGSGLLFWRAGSGAVAPSPVTSTVGSLPFGFGRSASTRRRCLEAVSSSSVAPDHGPS